MLVRERRYEFQQIDLVVLHDIRHSADNEFLLRLGIYHGSQLTAFLYGLIGSEHH